MKTYELIISRERHWWMISVPELDEITQARNLTEAEEMGRDLIAVVTDQKVTDFEIAVTIQQPTDIAALLADATTQEEKAREIASSAAHERREAVKALRDKYGMRATDTARLLGITRARVYQLLDN